MYEPPRYMTAAEAAQQLMTVVANRRASGSNDPRNTHFHLILYSRFLPTLVSFILSGLYIQ